MGNEQSSGPGATDLASYQAVALWLRSSGYRHEFVGKFKDPKSLRPKFFRFSLPWGSPPKAYVLSLICQNLKGKSPLNLELVLRRQTSLRV